MDLVGQTAGYISGRQPAPKKGGGFMSHLNPMQFKDKIPGMGGGAAGGGEAAAGGASVEELAPLLLL